MIAAAGTRVLKILLVEDNAGDALFVRRALGRLKTSTQLLVAATGEEALALLESDAPETDRPALILLDLNLPGINGLELLEALRHDTRLKNTCVIILSSSNADRDVERARELNADDYLLKPDSLPELYRLLEQIEEKWFHRLPLAGNREPMEGPT